MVDELERYFGGWVCDDTTAADDLDSAYGVECKALTGSR